MACAECLFEFFYDPLKVSIALASFLTAIVSLYFFKKSKMDLNKKIYLIYLHIFTLIFPFIFYAFSYSCDSSIVFFFCGKAEAIIYAVFSAFILSMLGGYLTTPHLIKRLNKPKEINNNSISSIVGKYSKRLKIKKPKLYLLDIAKPTAYTISCFKPYIFISVGLMDLLSKKEIEAVLLHELGHIKNRSSFLKFSAFFTRLVSPLAKFVTFFKELTDEERKADKIAIRIQKTPKYLISAKRKINCFNCYSSYKIHL